MAGPLGAGRLDPDECRRYLALAHLGGKPPYHRAEIHEEVDAAPRTLCLQGFLAANLLPGFYQLRNLTARWLVHEMLDGPAPRPEVLFRRATNDRAAQLLQDVEIMLRGVLRSAFQALPEADVRVRLETKQGDAELLPATLNRALLDWAGKSGVPNLREGLSALLVEHRKEFKVANSVWNRVRRLMRDDGVDVEGAAAIRLRAVDYLTFSELGDLLLELLAEAFPRAAADPKTMPPLKERWREQLAKIRRLRNRVAHLRNVDFQDMEDLVGMVATMRADVDTFAGWR